MACPRSAYWPAAVACRPASAGAGRRRKPRPLSLPWVAWPASAPRGQQLLPRVLGRKRAVFSFLYLKKNKILKIYVGFGKFQKYTPVAL